MAIAALMGVGTAVKGEEVPSLDLNFDGTTSSFTRATTSPTAAKANGDQLATSILTQGKTGTVQSMYMGPDGKLIKGYVTNGLPESHPYGGSWWTSGDYTPTDNYGTAPDGSQTSVRYQYDASAGFEQFYRTSSVVPALGAVYTASIWYKGSGSFRINCQQSGTTEQTNAQFTATSQWQRAQVQHTVVTGGGTGNMILAVWMQNALGSADIEFWGAQIEEGAAASQHVPTSGTSASDQVARVEYDASGNPLGLLVEEARTNLWPSGQSNFGNATAGGGSTASTTAVTAPDGTTDNIWAITESGTVGSHHVFTAVSVSASTAYTASYYLKKGSEDYGFIYFEGTAFSSVERVWFNLANGTVGTETGSSVGHISDAGNGWYRCSVTTTSGTTTTTAYASVGFSSTDGSFNSSGASAITGYYWGMQVEAGEGPTSLIYDDTTGSVTRPADDITLATSGFGFDNTASSVAMSVNGLRDDTIQRLLSMRDSGNTSNERADLLHTVSNQMQQFVRNASGVQVSQNIVGVTGQSARTVAATIAQDDYRLSMDGSSPIADTNAAVPTINEFRLGAGINSPLNGHIRRLRYWPRAINDAQLSKFTNQ